MKEVLEKRAGPFPLWRLVWILVIALPLALFPLLDSRSSPSPPSAAVTPDRSLPSYSFGVFPFVTAVRAEAIFAPLGGHLGQALSREIRYRSDRSFERFMQRLADQDYDIAFVQPFDYVRIARPAGYVPLMTVSGHLEALLVVPPNSPISHIEQLKQKRLGLPPQVAAASYLSEAMLLAAGLEPRLDLELRHFQTHDACLQQLLIGGLESCAVVSPTLELFESRMGVRFHPIAKSRPIPNPLFVAHRRIAKKERELLRHAFATYTPPLSTKDLWDIDQPFQPVSEDDYEIVQTLYKEIESHRRTQRPEEGKDPAAPDS